MDLLTANIVIEPLLTLLPDVPGVLKPGGIAIFSGMVRKERETFLEALGHNGLVKLDELDKGEWWGVSAQIAP